MFSHSNENLQFKERPFENYRLIEESIDRSLVNFDLYDGFSKFYYACYGNGFGHNFYFASVNSTGGSVSSANEILSEMDREMYECFMTAIRMYERRVFIIVKVDDKKPVVILHADAYPEYDVKYFIRDMVERYGYLSGVIVMPDSSGSELVLLNTESLLASD